MDIYTILFLIAVILYIISEFLTKRQKTKEENQKKWHKWKLKF